MALSRTFLDGDLLTSADINDHLVNRVPNPGDAYDTGWVDVTLATGFTATAPVQVCRIGQVIYWRGRILRSAGNFPLGTVQTVVSDGGVPAFARVPTSWSNSASVISNDSNGLAYVAVTGGAALAITALNVASNNYYIKPLSGYVVN